jgi:hypothetical protein
LGGVVRARGATWWWSSCPRLHVQTASKKPRHATKSKLRGPRLLTCTSATRANPNRHSSESKDEIWVSNHRLGQFRISAPVTRSNPNPDSHSRCGYAASQASLRAMTAHLEGSVLRDRKGTQAGDLASNNLKDKRRTTAHMTKTETHTSEVRCCYAYLIFASIEDMCGSNGAAFCTSCLGDTADLILLRSGAGALNHARTCDTTHDMPGCQNYAHQMPLVASTTERTGGGKL